MPLTGVDPILATEEILKTANNFALAYNLEPVKKRSNKKYIHNSPQKTRLHSLLEKQSHNTEESILFMLQTKERRSARRYVQPRERDLCY
jgi:hypothetical protein